ncbi:protein Wiz [Etheostoma spectabile]|uniref:protein Wiz n=1 Tax=Etheostoma spectabile TaxID=54343 RepID=UPI0013AFCCDE|nr:protein Wiz-like [Etheostoma spectabile]
MEPEERPLTPGTSIGPPSLQLSTQSPPPSDIQKSKLELKPSITLHCSRCHHLTIRSVVMLLWFFRLQSSCPPNVRDGRMSAKRLWGPRARDEGPEQREGPRARDEGPQQREGPRARDEGPQQREGPRARDEGPQQREGPRARDEGPQQREGPQQKKGPRQKEGPWPGAEPGRSAQRRTRSSAFPSSLSWDSDSEKETLDEEELQHFSNPHGLAAHSPGSPSSGLRLDSEDDQEPEKNQLRSKANASPPVVGHNRNNESTKTEEPNTSQTGPADLADGDVWNASEGAKLFMSKVKPKEGCQMEEEEEEEEEEAGNNEAEKRPKGTETTEPERDVYTFPGDSDPESPPPAPWAHCTFIQRCRKKRVLLRPFSGLGTLKSPETDGWAGVSPPKSRTAETARLNRGAGVYEFEEAAVEEPLSIRERRDQEEMGGDPGKEIFTCVECSIYFKKQIHLQEHIVEHCQSTRLGKGGRFRCVECGWNLPNRLALSDHHRRHQESRLKILGEIEKLNENGSARELPKHRSSDAAITQDASPASNPDKMSDPDLVASPPLSPVSTPDPVPAVLDATPPNSTRTPAQPRAVPAGRRRFVCTKCNFSTRTPQALANHSKTHNRKNPALPADPPSCLASPSLACGHCAFLTSSQTAMRDHQKLVHPGRGSVSGAQAHETGQTMEPEHSSGPGSGSSPNASRGESQPEASEDGTVPPSRMVVSECAGNGRLCRRGKTWTHLDTFLDDGKLSGSEEEERDKDQSTQHGDNSPVGGKRQTRSRSSTDHCSTQQTAASSLPPGKCVKEEDELEVEQDGRGFCLRRRSHRVTAAPADSDVVDEEQVRRFLSEGILDEDPDEIDEDSEMFRSVERKCPYCPDRFHNGIGLANHVRGHLNRVGVSYNVRHFISPEEVKAIERKFSYQKKKKKVANFDPGTFSVMHCEFCSAGFDTRAGLSSHARAHLRDFGITNWDVTISPIHILRELFSSRPDLVIPTAPPRSPCSSRDEGEEGEGDEEEEEEEEGEQIVEVKLEEETSERTLSAAGTDASPSAAPQRCKQDDAEEESNGEGEEEDEEQLQLPALDALSSGRTDSDGPPPGEDADSKVHDLKCEVCGAASETRRGLSSHARSHLRQLGVGVSESSGAPIDLLYRLAKEQGDAGGQTGSSSPLPTHSPSPSVPRKDEAVGDMDLDEKPVPLSVLAKAAKAAAKPPPPSSSSSSSTPTPPPGSPPPSVVRKAPISSLLPVSSLLRSGEHKAAGMKGLMSNLSASAAVAAKPIWAPQEDDAPLNLTLEVNPNKDIVCQLCGAWFETRKGLSSHARAHLRHFGVEYSESKGSPIDLLNQLIDTDDFKHNAGSLQRSGPAEPRGPAGSKPPLYGLASSPPPSLLYKVTTAGGGSTAKATSSSSLLLGPPAKRHKSSSVRVFRLSSGELMALPHSDPPKEIGCEFCGEYFENRKGLSSHARSHLRQMGITEWSVNGSPIDTLREVITRRGLPCALPLKPLKTPPPSSPGPPRSPLPASASPSATLLGRLPFAFARPSSPAPSAASKSSSAATPPTASGGLILRLKPEPLQLDVTAPSRAAGRSGFSGDALGCSWSSSDTVFPLNLAMSHDVEPTRDIRCEFCGEYFENRKGLSSHARSHLRQMGITEWSVNGSPIDTLREVMHKRGGGTPSHPDQGVKKEASHGTGSPLWDNAEGLGVSGYQSGSKFRKSPLSLLQSAPRLHKHGPGAAAAAMPAGRFFRLSPLGKRPLSDEGQSAESAHSPPHQPKTYSPLPHDFSFKRKPSPDKPGHQDPSCELCGFYFENRKALASHARAHLRQFGVTEWCVNGSPIETLSAWMRSRPQKVLEMHRSYMQGNRSTLKKPGQTFPAPDPTPGAAPAPPPSKLRFGSQELTSALPRGIERRPLKHPSCPDGTESPPKPPRTGTVPALVPKPPSYPLVKLVGKFYTLKCRFCEVEFHGPLSVQEDWIRHLQQHILKMNYSRPAAPKAASAAPPAPADDPASAPASTSTSSTTSTTPPLTSTSTPTLGRANAPNSRSHTPPPVTATELVKVSEEPPTLSPSSIPFPTQTV